MSEIWLPVVGWEGYYEVSDQGRVRSLDRHILATNGRSRKQKGRILSPRAKTSGHLQLCLRSGNRVETPSVHRVVALAFLGKCPDGMECLHTDGNPSNNHVGNLSWGTRSENRYDMVRHGTHPQKTRSQCPIGHPLVAPNLRPRVWREEGRRQCLACARARSRVFYHKHLQPQFEEIADLYLERIMKNHPVSQTDAGLSIA